MLKAILSRKELSENAEFYSYVVDLLDCGDVRKLNDFSHHIGTSRLQHSLNVAYYNYLLCRFFRLNARAAARAGLLHDLFFYERKTHERIQNRHPAEHAKIALYNASMRFSISELEGDMILNHMWPATPHFPKHTETYVITVVDKFCALAELSGYFWRRLSAKFRSVQKYALAKFKSLRQHG